MTVTLEQLEALPIELEIGSIKLKLHPMTLSGIVQFRTQIKETWIKMAKLGANNAQERIEITVALAQHPISKADELEFINSHEGTRYFLYLLSRGDSTLSEEALGDMIHLNSLPELNATLAQLLGSKEPSKPDPPVKPVVLT